MGCTLSWRLFHQLQATCRRTAGAEVWYSDWSEACKKNTNLNNETFYEWVHNRSTFISCGHSAFNLVLERAHLMDPFYDWTTSTIEYFFFLLSKCSIFILFFFPLIFRYLGYRFFRWFCPHLLVSLTLKMGSFTWVN